MGETSKEVAKKISVFHQETELRYIGKWCVSKCEDNLGLGEHEFKTDFPGMCEKRLRQPVPIRRLHPRSSVERCLRRKRQGEHLRLQLLCTPDKGSSGRICKELRGGFWANGSWTKKSANIGLETTNQSVNRMCRQNCFNLWKKKIRRMREVPRLRPTSLFF